MEAEVWIIMRRRVVLCTEGGLGVPADVIIASDGTIGGTFFPAKAYVGAWPLPAMGWGKAGEVAQQTAADLGYDVEYDAPRMEGWVMPW
jgi:hypothetical protein